MMKRLPFAVAILALCAIATVVFAQRQDTHTASAKGRYQPEYCLPCHVPAQATNLDLYVRVSNPQVGIRRPEA